MRLVQRHTIRTRRQAEGITTVCTGPHAPDFAGDLISNDDDSIGNRSASLSANNSMQATGSLYQGTCYDQQYDHAALVFIIDFTDSAEKICDTLFAHVATSNHHRVSACGR